MSNNNIDKRKEKEQYFLEVCKEKEIMPLEEYEKINQYMNFRCACGNVFRGRVGTMIKGLGKCKKCISKRQSRVMSHNINYVKQCFEDKGCKLLSTEYRDNKQKLKFICPCGNEGLVSFAHFQCSNQTKCLKCLKREYKWNEDKIIVELKYVITKIGHFPMEKEMYLIPGLQKAISRSGGIKKYRTLLGYTQLRETWSEERIYDELRQIIQKTESFPITSYLKSNHYKLYHAIMEYQGISYWQRKFNIFKPIRKKIKPRIPNYWKNWDNVKNEIELYFTDMLINNQFPTTTMIKNKIQGNIFRGIKYFGGMKSVANKMGFELKTFIKTPSGNYVRSTYEYIVDCYLTNKGINYEGEGKLGSSNYKYDFKIDDCYIEIWGYPESNVSPLAIKYNERKNKKIKLYK